MNPLVPRSHTCLLSSHALLRAAAAEPTGTGPKGWPVAGSIRVTVPSWPSPTHTAAGLTAMPAGSRPAGTVLTFLPVTGLIWVSSPSLATHTPLRPLAMATGMLPTGTGRRTAWPRFPGGPSRGLRPERDAHDGGRPVI